MSKKQNDRILPQTIGETEVCLKQLLDGVRQHMPANPVQLSPVFLRRSSSANQAFVRFAVASCAAYQSHRAQNDLRFGTFSPGAGSRFENSGLNPYPSTGPVTLD